MLSRRTRTAPRPAAGSAWLEWGPVGIFGVMVCAGPLLFGAVDRWVQTGLAILLTVGMLVRPAPVVPGGRLRWLALAVVGLFVAKEFLPASVFGATSWRPVAEGELGLRLAWTHNPEPVRALDGLLVLLVGVVWFQWVRALAAKREHRAVMMWMLFCAGALVAAVCLLAKASLTHPSMIYGIRDTPGWVGWGPFPNRNHTSSLLAMAIILGLGCVCWSFARKRRGLIVAAVAGVLLLVAALLNGKSRGGLLALVAGATVFAVLVLAKRRDRQALQWVLAGIVGLSALVLAFGGSVIARFSSHEEGGVSNNMRVEIWKNVAGMGMDAPVFGHGVETFTQVFPLYNRLELDRQVVLHPESSWLLAFAEMGALPLALVLILLGCVVGPGLRAGFEGRARFYIFAGALAAVGALLAHCLVDVPGHRWGTAGFALAALALACPARGDAGIPAGRTVALVPAAVAAFWILPFVIAPPPWSPMTAGIYLERAVGKRRGPQPKQADYEAVLRYFPLAVMMHQAAGIAQLAEGKPGDGAWQRHFETVHRLAPGSWDYAIAQARAIRGVSPLLAVRYCQVAVERSGRRRIEILRTALMETARFPGALSEWDRYVRAHPELALGFARALVENLRMPPDAARQYFDLWWDKRARGAVSELEVEDFNHVAPGWADENQIGEWVRLHANRRRKDFRVWVAALHKAGNDRRAWDLYAGVQKAPEYSGLPPGATREQLEASWRFSPDNPAYARALAEFHERAGEKKLMRDLVIEVARSQEAPLWFIRKGAHVLADEGRIAEAVALALRDR